MSYKLRVQFDSSIVINYIIERTMKKVSIFVILSLLIGCSGNPEKKDISVSNNTQTDSAESVSYYADINNRQDIDKAKACLQKIYSDVFAWYTKAEYDNSLLGKAPDFEALYMSSAYNNTLKNVRKIDNKLAEDGLIGFFDSDHWVCGQDFENLKFEIKKGKIESGTFVTSVTVWNMGAKNDVGIKMVYENGKWLIDDMILNGNSERKSMQRYIENEGRGE